MDMFNALPDSLKQEVLTEIAGRSCDLDEPELVPHERASIADAIFLEYDRQEAEE